MSILSRSSLALVALFLSFFAVSTAKHAPSKHCNVYDLLEDCKEKVIKIAGNGEDDKSLGELDTFLIDECQEMSGLLVAKCLMKYLCLNHGEEAVDSVDECVRDVCPLAKRLPKKLCHKRRRLGGKAAFFEEEVLQR